MTAKRFRAYDANGHHVVAEGDLNTKGNAVFDSGDVEIGKVVFYAGDLESESVFGTATVTGSGKFTVSTADIDAD
jgi:hypothetical protein